MKVCAKGLPLGLAFGLALGSGFGHALGSHFGPVFGLGFRSQFQALVLGPNFALTSQHVCNMKNNLISLSAV